MGPAAKLWRGLKGAKDCFENPFDVLHNLAVRDAEHSNASGGENGVAAGICDRVMRIAIDLDRKAACRAEEIDNKIADDGLPTEFETPELGAGEAGPQALFGLGWIRTH